MYTPTCVELTKQCSRLIKTPRTAPIHRSLVYWFQVCFAYETRESPYRTTRTARGHSNDNIMNTAVYYTVDCMVPTWRLGQNMGQKSIPIHRAQLGRLQTPEPLSSAEPRISVLAGRDPSTCSL
jgi:hypothetical protein